MSKIGDKLAGMSGLWDVVLAALLKELKKQARDLVIFVEWAEELGAEATAWTETGWKVLLAGIEFVALHGTPTEETVEKFLRKKKLIA